MGTPTGLGNQKKGGVMQADQYTDPVADHGEGVIWDSATGRLLWVDMLAGDVLVDENGRIFRHHVGAVAAALRPRRAGGYVVALRRRFALTDADLVVHQAYPPIWNDDQVRFNEGSCDPQGRFYCGTMVPASVPGRGEMYRLDPDGGLCRVLTGLTVSNGLAWSPDGSAAYYVDTATGTVDVLSFDPAAGEFAERRTLVIIDPAVGRPDGLTVDSTGAVWVALWGGGGVHCYDPDGTLLDRIEVPVAHVTSCSFGGPELQDLYITTSRCGPAPAEPAAGALFRCRPGATGLPVATFAG